MRPLFTDDEERTVFAVALDDVTVARLIELSEAAKVPPAILIAAMVRDVLEDDVIAHETADESDTVYRRDAHKGLN